MKKYLSYISLLIFGVIIVAAFVTATNYYQLAIAIILYPLLAYLVIKIIPHGESFKAAVSVQPTIPVQPTAGVSTSFDKDRVEIVDIDKRTFLKLIGTAGVSFFLFSILGRTFENLIFGRNQQSGLSNIGLPFNDQASDVQTSFEGYRISEIDDNIVSYYGFINKDGNWLIMREDTENNSFRYAKGDTDFSKNWGGREKLNYVYYHNLF